MEPFEPKPNQENAHDPQEEKEGESSSKEQGTNEITEEEYAELYKKDPDDYRKGQW